ncbi:Epimerase family protein [Rubripirellula lacrimiformis]|uniref:Epimerase family protein n=1 Tax=Rubripirellula lacrimiformis TaxID=1930273 RepID=A0A517N781_9BACT|nr:TIGR01777 family oxidoreductase [Rubripirellula lacrimiformis]QDT03004.1 Epimerase family protein [Rubripirellula lacrimiformis]
MSSTQEFVAQVSLPCAVEDAFAYHDRPGALARLIPPWESVELEHSDDSLAVGSRVTLTTKFAGIPLRWHAQHTLYDPPRQFADTQLSGPFAAWDHSHQFTASGDQSILRDSISYRIPAGSVGRLMTSGLVRKKIQRMFAYRHRLTHDDLQLQADRPAPAMTVAISGSTGMVGSQLSALLGVLGHRTRAIVRSADGSEDQIAAWSGDSEVQKLDGVDAVVHLAGKPIADCRWTDSVKQQIRDSRVIKTRQLCQSLAGLKNKPKVLICASATGIYGDRGDDVLTESSAPDTSFLADVAKQWEQACQAAVDAGIRVVHVRFGIILSPQGGALAKSLLPAKFAGGSLGSGQQWWSWIALDDAVGSIYHAITDPEINGAVNVVSPHPIRNVDFAKTLGRVLGRPALFPAPAFALRLALGEMADALLLASARVKPTKLESAGYRFRFTDLESFLRYALGKDLQYDD